LRPARANITSRKNGNNVNIKLATAALGAALILAGSPAFAADVQPAATQTVSVQVSSGAMSNANAKATSDQAKADQAYASESQYLRPTIPGSNGDYED
jgi:hypothetical protein